MQRVTIAMGALFCACWITLSAGPVQADERETEIYKATIDNLVSQWATAEIALINQVVPVLDELRQKKALSNPSDDDKARIAALEAQRDSLADQMDNESLNLQVELTIVEVQPGPPERELVVIPDWLKGIIKAKGIPLGHGLTLTPDADFDVKALKLKSFSAGLRYNWSGNP